MATDAEGAEIDETEIGRYGPLLPRRAHFGGILLILASVVFLLGNFIAEILWDGSPPYGAYSLTNNYISDLGAVYCGPVVGVGGLTREVCSPGHDVFNAMVIVAGILLVLAVLLLRSAFADKRISQIGLILLAIAGIGTAGVGSSPEDVNLTIHSISALTGFLLGNIALVVLGFAMFRDTRWSGFRTYTIVSGLVGLVALGLFLAHAWGPIGVGGMERLTVFPLILWGIVAGIHLVRIPTYAPSGLPKPAS